MTDQSPTRGCLKAAISLPALIVLAPGAALIRTISRWRRGQSPKVDWRWSTITVGDGRSMARLQAVVDLSLDVDGGRTLTEATVRFAERLRTGDEVYHVVHDEPGGDGEVIVPLGPSIQALAERFYLVSRRSALEGLPVMWISLPRERALGEALGFEGAFSEAFDRMQRMPVLWGMVSERRAGTASIRHHLDLVVPEESAAEVETALLPLRDSEIRG